MSIVRCIAFPTGNAINELRRALIVKTLACHVAKVITIKAAGVCNEIRTMERISGWTWPHLLSRPEQNPPKDPRTASTTILDPVDPPTRAAAYMLRLIPCKMNQRL